MPTLEFLVTDKIRNNHQQVEVNQAGVILSNNAVGPPVQVVIYFKWTLYHSMKKGGLIGHGQKLDEEERTM